MKTTLENLGNEASTSSAGQRKIITVLRAIVGCLPVAATRPTLMAGR
jgi:hypothetical protein